MIARKFFALAMVAAFAAPAATATWMSFGSYEPDTTYDASGDWTWTDPPTHTGAPQVYFNAYLASHTANVGLAGVNPNVGAAGSHFGASGYTRWYGIFGIWRDCNGDGYVGMAETAVLEYRAELLLDASTCPIDVNTGSPPPGTNGASWAATKRPTHNDGEWINEFLFIGNPRQVLGDGTQQESAGTDPRIFIDHDSRIWGDPGLPGQPGAGGGRCPTNPQPRGTWQSTGGLLQFADCTAAVGDEWNTVVGTADPSNSLGLALVDERDWNQDGHPLNVGTFGDEDSEYSMARAFDCNQVAFQQTVASNTVTVYQPDPAVHRTDGTVAGTVNETSESAPVQFGTDNSADCNTSNEREGDLYGRLEDDWERVEAGNRKEVGVQMFFTFMARGGVPGKALDATDPHAQVPQDMGLIALNKFFGTYWAGESVPVGATTPVPARTGLALPDDADPNPELGANPVYWTWYAYTSLAGGKGWATPGGVGIYGDEWCHGVTSGIQDGFNCDADEWVRNADGSTPADRAVRTLAHDPYLLRDIDCFDSNPTYHAATPFATCG